MKAARVAASIQSVDVDSLELLRPRSVAIEHVALAALREVGFDGEPCALGFNGPQQAATIAPSFTHGHPSKCRFCVA